jgi:hypothetical protein
LKFDKRPLNAEQNNEEGVEGFLLICQSNNVTILIPRREWVAFVTGQSQGRVETWNQLPENWLVEKYVNHIRQGSLRFF